MVVIPTYNEIDSLPVTLGRLTAASPDVDVLVVDDVSPNGTGDLADRLAAADPRVNVLHRTAKDGLGRTYLAGLLWGLDRGHGVLVEMDADGSHPPENQAGMLQMLDTDPRAGLVIGSRWTAGGRVVDSRGYCFQIDMTIRTRDAGWRIVESPIEFRDREAGVSKMSAGIVVEAMTKLTVWAVQRRLGARRDVPAIDGPSS